MNRKPTTRHQKRTNAKPWIRAVLSNERYYGDAKLNIKGLLTATQAWYARSRMVKSLGRSKSNDNISLANRLDACDTRDRCLSGACPECNRALQLFYIEQGMLATQQAEGSFSVVSIVARPKPELGFVHKLNLESLKYQLKRSLARNGITLAIGGVDVSLNEHQGDEAPRWTFQFWLILRDVNTEWRSAVRALYPRTLRAPRPVRIESWDGRAEAIAYMLKPNFVRRISITGKNGRANTRHERLRQTEKAELAAYLDKTGLASRTFLLGIRPTLTGRRFALVVLKRNQ